MGRRHGPGPVLLAAGVAGLAASYAGVRSGRAAPLDAVADRLRVPLGAPADRVLGTATDLGSVYGVLGAAGVLAATGRRDVALDVAGAGLVAWVLGQGAKPVLPRSRPYQSGGAERLVAEPAGTSWPSGHSAVSAAVGTVIADHAASRPVGVAAGTALAGFVGASRVYVGVHHATDVTAGWGVGVVAAWLWRRVRSRPWSRPRWFRASGNR